MIDKLLLGSTIFHLTTFISLGLSSVYQSKLAGFLALVSLMLGLYMNKLANDKLGCSGEENTNEDDVLEYSSDDPYLATIVGKPQIQPPETRNRPYK